MFVLLSLLDILVASMMGLGIKGAILSVLGLIMLVKGIYSLSTSLGGKYYFDWMGWIDLITGVIIIFDVSLVWFWLVLFVKGCYSLIFSLIK